MEGFNKVILMGRLTWDPELRHTSKGTAVTDIGLAVSGVYNNSDGQQEEEAAFVTVTFWGRMAEVIYKYMDKGRQLFVEGRLKFDTWDNKEGQKRSKLSVVAYGFQFIDSRKFVRFQSSAGRGNTYRERPNGDWNGRPPESWDRDYDEDYDEYWDDPDHEHDQDWDDHDVTPDAAQYEE